VRDLWRMKGQGIAIGAVIAVGVLMLVMMQGLVVTLEETKSAYFDRYRIADVFAPAVRVPDRVRGKLADIPGVVAVEGRSSAAHSSHYQMSTFLYRLGQFRLLILANHF